MRCQVCGRESYQYAFCKECYAKNNQGELIDCPKCGLWHEKEKNCSLNQGEDFLYASKETILSNNEQQYHDCIKKFLPSNCLLHVQANLASFIKRTDGAKFQNELYRNVDFLVTNVHYKPLFAIEINDRTHLTSQRKERDEKVKKICEEAGIPIVKFWTSYGVNEEYISKKISETLLSLPAERVHHFSSAENAIKEYEFPVHYDTQPQVETASANINGSQTQKVEKPWKKAVMIAIIVCQILVFIALLPTLKSNGFNSPDVAVCLITTVFSFVFGLVSNKHVMTYPIIALLLSLGVYGVSKWEVVAVIFVVSFLVAKLAKRFSK